MIDIEKIHDKFFKENFSAVENTRDFLDRYLPPSVRKFIDLDNIKIDKTGYISEEMKEFFADLIVKTALLSNKKIKADIYILLEHKSTLPSKGELFLQILNYQYLMWREDINNKKPLRLIIPFVFYHNTKKWDIPIEFKEIFEAPEEILEYIVNFKYILFDTNEWNLEDELNKGLKKNIFLITAIMLLKSAYEKNLTTVEKIIDFWAKNGFFETMKDDRLLFFLIYIAHTKDLTLEELEKVVKKADKKGEKIMPSLADRIIKEYGKDILEQGIQQGLQQGLQKGVQQGFSEGQKKNAIATAKKMLSLKKYSIKEITQITGLKNSEVERLNS